LPLDWKDTIEITRARPAQAAELTRIAIAAKAHWGYPERWMALWAPLLAISPDYIATNEVWAAALGPEIAGFYSLTDLGRAVSLENMWVLPRYIRQGLGRGLFSHALARCRQLGYETLRIEADPHAQGFYEHMGAHKIGEHVDLLDGQPRILPLLEMALR